MRKVFFLAVAFVLLLPIFGRADEISVRSVDGRDDIVLLKDGWKYGLKKVDGSIIAPCEYEEILPVEGSSSHFVIALGGKYGVVDEYGTVLLPVKYSYVVPKLYGSKLLVQQGGTMISEALLDISIPDNDPYFIHIGSGDNEKKFRFMEITPLDWIPYNRWFTTNGQWGLADIRPNVSMIFPSYSMVSVSPDDDRYILMGYTFGTVSAYNIYDTKKETFLLSMEKKVQYSSLYLLKGGYFLVNGFLRRLDAPESNISSTKLSLVADLNKDYCLCQSGKNVLLIAKASGRQVEADRNISHYIVNSVTGDFLLKESGSWILYSEGKRSGGFAGDLTFMGGYPVELVGEKATVVIDGRSENRTRSNAFFVTDDKKSIIYVNADNNLVKLEYPSKEETLLFSGCSGFQVYYSNPEYVVVKKNEGWGEKAGLLDIASGKLIVPFKYSDIRPLYGDYFAAAGDQNSLRRLGDPDFEFPIVSLNYNDYTHEPYCWVSNARESDSFALYSMEKDSLLTDYRYTGVEMAKYPGRMMMLGHDYIPFIRDSKKGIMDTGGNEVFPAEYDQLLFSFTEGFCIVSKEKMFGSVNPYTGIALPCVYEDVGRFVHGRCIVKQDGLWGIVDNNGETIVPNRYKSIADYFDDLNWLRKEHFVKKLNYGVLDDNASPAVVEWFDKDGTILCKGTASVPLVQSVIPEGLWDY